jgi:hypothetical protein
MVPDVLHDAGTTQHAQPAIRRWRLRRRPRMSKVIFDISVRQATRVDL